MYRSWTWSTYRQVFYALFDQINKSSYRYLLL